MAGTWIAAICTLGLMSFVIKDSPLYRLAEYTFLAVGTAYSFVLSLERLNPVIITPIKQGKYTIFIPVALGLLLYSRFFRGKQWLMGFPISVTIGVGLGLSLKGIVSSEIVKQLSDTYTSIGSLEGVLIFVGVICVILFFYFSRSNTGANPPVLAVARKIGRVFLMIAFGCMFSNVILSRMTLLLGRIKFLLGDWLNII